MHVGDVSSWLPSDWMGLPSHLSGVEGPMIRRSPRLPTEPIQIARIPADQSRPRAFRRERSIDSSPMGSGSLRPSQRSDPDSPRLLTNEQMLLPARRTTMHSPTTSPSTTPTLARERFQGEPRRPLRGGLGILPRGQRRFGSSGRVNRVAVAEAIRQPFPRLRAHGGRREINPPRPSREGGLRYREDQSQDTTRSPGLPRLVWR